MLQYYRKEIDKIDKEIVKLLKERMAVSEEIGKIKKEKNIPVTDKEREEEKLKEIADMAGLHYPSIHNIYTSIFEESRKIQK